MKFEYGVTNDECVEKKKFGGQKLKKKKDKLFAVCRTLAHGKVCVCRVPASSTLQTQGLSCA